MAAISKVFPSRSGALQSFDTFAQPFVQVTDPYSQCVGRYFQFCRQLSTVFDLLALFAFVVTNGRVAIAV
jgi:hypothetical protein